MNTEKFIRDSAANGLSKRQVMQALNLCRETFSAMLDAMPPLQWAPKGRSLGHRLSNEARRGQCSPALHAALIRTAALRKERRSHDVDGHHGTIEDLAPIFGVSASTVRRRLRAGMPLEQALKTPPTPFKLRRNGFGVTR